MESPKDSLGGVFLFFESSETLPRLLNRSELEWIDLPKLLFAEKVVYPPKLDLNARPTHLHGLFWASCCLKGYERPTEPLTKLVTISKSWAQDIFAPAVFMLSYVTIDAEKRVTSSDARSNISRDMDYHELARLQSCFQMRSPGHAFLQTVKRIPSYYCSLHDYLRPYPTPTAESSWIRSDWPLKKAVNELCTRIGVKVNHVPTTAIDIGASALNETQSLRMFWTKIELTRENADGAMEILPGTFLAQNGPFQKKADSENAACIAFLTDFHDSDLEKNNPDLYFKARLLLGEAPVADSGLDSNHAPVEASSSDRLSSVPEDIKNPSMESWNRYSLASKIDFFGNGAILKSIVKQGSGLSLGVSCSVTAWVSVLSEGDDKIETIYSSKFEEVTIGAFHDYLPIPTLCSMRIGEAAYFLVSSDLVCNPNLDSAPSNLEKGVSMLIAVFVPSATNISFANNYPIESNESSTLVQRMERCSSCSTDAVALYRSKQYKVALDYYQIGLKEMSYKNLDYFKTGLVVLRSDIEWTVELESFKACFIRNRLGAAACCLYIDHWPHFNDHWKLGSTAIEEGLLACDAVLKLEPKHFVALRRKALLLIKNRDFDSALKVIGLAGSTSEAATDDGMKDLENLKADLQHTKQKDLSDDEALAKSLGKNLFL